MPRQGGLHEKLQTSGMWTLVMRFDWADFIEDFKGVFNVLSAHILCRGVGPHFRRYWSSKGAAEGRQEPLHDEWQEGQQPTSRSPA